MPHTFRIAVIAGDGIGPEVIAEAIRVADAFNHRIQKFATGR